MGKLAPISSPLVGFLHNFLCCCDPRFSWEAESYLAVGEGPSEQMKGVRIRVFTRFKLCEHFE